jgi:hypothetical protein
VWFCITACKLSTNTKASSLNQPRATHRIAVLSSHACGFVLPLANSLQIQKHHHSTNREQRIKFVVLNIDEFSEMSEWLGQRYEDILKQYPWRRPRNPRFKDAHAGTKRRLKAKTINRDSGISGTARALLFLKLANR